MLTGADRDARMKHLRDVVQSLRDTRALQAQTLAALDTEIARHEGALREYDWLIGQERLQVADVSHRDPPPH